VSSAAPILGLMLVAYVIGLLMGFGLGWIEGGLFILRGILKARAR
jgi:hypothetical protein